MEKFIEIAKIFKPDFVVDDNNKMVIETLLKPKSKGTLIIGGVGTGKTLLMKLYNEYLKATKYIPVKIINVKDICFDFMVKGYSGIEKYYREEDGENKYKYRSLCIDDLGLENPLINYYGTTEDIISNLLYLRHGQNALTFATSNFDIQMIKKRYGDRLCDRINEMFEIVYLLGNSRRK